MRVSQYYKLKRTQAELDFVDVDIRGDTPLFLDPTALRNLSSDWAHESVAYIQDFFTTVLDSISAGRNNEARRLLRGLREPNETHLGFSSGRARGRALGPDSARNVWDALRTSHAVQSGLLVHLEDTILLVPGIGSDIVSDIATNLIRIPLIRYTQEICQRYEIPLKPQVISGHLWNPKSKSWAESQLVPLPVTTAGRLLLTPKSIVRRKMEYNAQQYYDDFIIPFLEQEEIRAGTSLVKVLKKRRTKYVTKKDLSAKYGKSKGDITRITLQNPGLLEQYKAQRSQTPVRTLSEVALAEATGSALPDYTALLNQMKKIPTGKKHANEYHAAADRVISALFSSALTMGYPEYPIHDGRKRLDLIYVNTGEGFFGWVATHYRAAQVVVECKNYTGDPANPELDQLSGRFSLLRGQFGILACRGFKDKELFMERCRDTAKDGRGFIIALDDDDFTEIVALKEAVDESGIYKFLMDRFQFLLT